MVLTALLFLPALLVTAVLLLRWRRAPEPVVELELLADKLEAAAATLSLR